MAHRRLQQGSVISKLVLEIGRPFAARFGIDHVRDRRHIPRSFDHRETFRKECRGQSIERIGLECLVAQNLFQKPGLQCSYAHALAIDRIEAAYRVANGQQAAWERFQPIETPPYAGLKSIALKSAQALGILDGTVNRLRIKLPGIIDESLRIVRWP